MEEREREAESERMTETAPPLVEEVQEENVQSEKERVELELSVAFTAHADNPKMRRIFTLVNMNEPLPEKERREEVMLKDIEANAGMNVMEVRVREPLDAAMKEYGSDEALTVLRRRKVSEAKLRETSEDAIVKRDD